jgi:hypothetical protein
MPTPVWSGVVSDAFPLLRKVDGVIVWGGSA